MPQIMIEAFARNLIDKIMLEAFDVVDPNDEKLRMLNDRPESAAIESQSTRTALQMRDLSCANRNELESRELIEQMARGLRNLQIGDSTSVSSPLSALEKQVKHVICNIGSVSLTDLTKNAETRVTQGQGDVHQIVHDAVIETTTDLARSRLEKETNGSNEATRVSISLLHRMIEELETKTEETGQEKETVIESVSTERIAAWEETEEQFIRTIESVDEPDQSNTDSPSESNSRINACEFAYEGIPSSSAVCSIPFAKNISLEEVAIEEIVSSPLPKDDPSDEATSSKSQRNDRKTGEKKKRNVLGRMRKLFRTIFGHRKK